jgi:hypothetical protein
LAAFRFDDELELLRLLHCKIGGLGAFETVYAPVTAFTGQEIGVV